MSVMHRASLYFPPNATQVAVASVEPVLSALVEKLERV